MLSNHPKIRVGLYVAALASQIASFFVAVINLELAGAFVATAGVLSTAAGIAALTNITPPTDAA